MIMYSRCQLLLFRRAGCLLPESTVSLIRSFGLQRMRRRGVRAGRNKQRGISIISSSWRHVHSQSACRKQSVVNHFDHSDPCIVTSPTRLNRSLLKVRVDRHTTPPGTQLICGCLNVRSLANKIDDLFDVRRVQLIDVLFLTETWHDADSICLRRLRAEGFQVVDRARPRLRTDTLKTNHGGIVVAATSGVRLSVVDLGVKPSTFELLCVRVVSGASSFIAATIYRPGSVAISASFFAEISDVLDRLATFVEPVLLTGDVNIRLERSTDSETSQFIDMLAACGLAHCPTSATHNLGGSLDVVALRTDMLPLQVDVIDVDLSDHRLLRWMMPLVRPSPVYSSTTRRSWSRLDKDFFRTALRSSLLSRPESWSSLNVDELAQLYDKEITDIVDGMIPMRTVRFKRRPSDPWFDEECRLMKRDVRRLERQVRRADPVDVAAATASWYASRRAYRDLRRRKRETFWSAKIDAERSTPRQLWRSIDTLMGRGQIPITDSVSADVMHRFFDAKVATVRASTSDAPPPTFVAAPLGCVLRVFRPLTIVDVTAAVRALPNKQCMSDPLPTQLLKDNADVLAPFLVELLNRSLELGVVPSVFKSAYITPLLKKADLDPADAKSYRPISNLSVLSKLLERLVARQLLDYLKSSNLLPRLQSAYRTHHSTETAVLKVLADILRAVDSGDLALLTLLDLSAAFDTVDHVTLLRRLEVSYGISGTVHNWFTSYLGGRRQFVRCQSTKSTPTAVLFGVPQGSVLGPILFLLYTADLIGLVESHGLQPHLYADDTQIYGFCRPGNNVQLQNRMSACVDDVGSWMQSNRLQLNATKTEVMWCASARRQHQVPDSPLMVGSLVVPPVRSVRDLGIYLDSDLLMRTHVTRSVSTCFAVLRQIRSIRRSISRSVLQSLIVSLVLSRLDYGSATLVGLPARLLDRLQSVLNAAARLIYGCRKYDHVTPLLHHLHWLRVPERITFRLAVLVYRCQHGLAPRYLSDELHRVADVGSRQRLRSAATSALIVPNSVHSTIGDRAFPVAATRVWNSLPQLVTSSPSLTVFRRRLKTELFTRSFGLDS